MRDADGRVLLVERPKGKIAALKWEFPGGKIENGETPREALDRELHEEIGVAVRQARPLIRFTHEYLERTVTLYTWQVTGWDGGLQAREGQRFAWTRPHQPHGLDVLPTVDPILRALRLPEDYVFTPAEADASRLLEGLARLPRGALLRLRLPGLDDAAYRTLAHSLRDGIEAAGLQLVVDRDEAMARRLGAAGIHYPQVRLSTVVPAGAGERLIRLASCHDAASLARATRLGLDGVVLGPVCDTSSHPGGRPLGWDDFATLTQDTALPVYAIGGLGPHDKPAAFSHYAQGVAGISAYWSRSEP